MRAGELDLVGAAATGAALLEQRFPPIVFTSGRRGLPAQAHAMAVNVSLAGRSWIARTYRPTAASEACQAWIDEHPEAVATEEVARGLLEVLEGLGEAAAGISRHLTGEAFDIAPMGGPLGRAVLAAAQDLAGVERVLTHEAGLERWHVQFYPRNPA